MTSILGGSLELLETEAGTGTELMIGLCGGDYLFGEASRLFGKFGP